MPWLNSLQGHNTLLLVVNTASEPQHKNCFPIRWSKLTLYLRHALCRRINQVVSLISNYFLLGLRERAGLVESLAVNYDSILHLRQAVGMKPRAWKEELGHLSWKWFCDFCFPVYSQCFGKQTISAKSPDNRDACTVNATQHLFSRFRLVRLYFKVQITEHSWSFTCLSASFLIFLMATQTQ